MHNMSPDQGMPPEWATAALELPELSDEAFINISETRRRIVVELHVEGPLTMTELVWATGRPPRRLAPHLRSLADRGVLTCTALTERRRAKDWAELYALAL